MGFLWGQEFGRDGHRLFLCSFCGVFVLFGRDGNFTGCFCVVSVEFLCSLEGVGTSQIVFV